jgi:antirestriction protein ArdC
VESRRRKSEGNQVEHDAVIDAVLENLNVNWLHGDSGCWYRPSTDHVNIPKEYRWFDTTGQRATQAYYVVVFHEVVHWTKKRVDREAFTGEGVGFRCTYAAEELVAELGALT